MKRLVFLLIFIFFILDPIFAQNLTMKGLVSDIQGKPINQAEISVDGNLGDAISDDNGIFILKLSSSVKLGQSIRIRAAKNGFRPWDRLVTVSSDKPIVIKLQKKQIN